MKYFELGQTVYHPVYGEGKVDDTENNSTHPIGVNFEDNYSTFTLDGREDKDEPITLSQNPIPEIVNKPLEDTYIPFTFEDKDFLRGRWIRLKDNSIWEAQIIFINNHKIGILVNSATYISYEDLLNGYEFLDGKPCGKLG